MSDLWDGFDYGEAEASGVLALRLVSRLLQSPELRPVLVAELTTVASLQSDLGIEIRMADQAKRLLASGTSSPAANKA